MRLKTWYELYLVNYRQRRIFAIYLLGVCNELWEARKQVYYIIGVMMIMHIL